MSSHRIRILDRIVDERRRSRTVRPTSWYWNWRVDDPVDDVPSRRRWIYEAVLLNRPAGWRSHLERSDGRSEHHDIQQTSDKLKLRARFSRPASGPTFMHADWLTYPCGELWLVETDHATSCTSETLMDKIKDNG